MNKLLTNFSEAISPYVQDVYTDVLGNIIAHIPGKGKRIMLIAHQDVVRLMVTHIDVNGFIYVKPAGSIDVAILPARKVIIEHENKSVIGIIGKKPIHLLREEQSCKTTYDNLWIDIGTKGKEETLQLVSKGDYVYFCTEREELQNGLLVSSYLDDQVGINILLALAKRLNTAVSNDLYFVASNNEEIGMRGASVAAHSIQPDVCICIDVTHATDYPTMNIIVDGEITLGGGCVLAKGPNIYPKLINKLEETARNKCIPYQIEVSPYATGTDANIIQISQSGVETAVVSIPCRYMHTPYEICSKTDIESAVNLIYEFLRNK